MPIKGNALKTSFQHLELKADRRPLITDTLTNTLDWEWWLLIFALTDGWTDRWTLLGCYLWSELQGVHTGGSARAPLGSESEPVWSAPRSLLFEKSVWGLIKGKKKTLSSSSLWCNAFLYSWSEEMITLSESGKLSCVFHRGEQLTEHATNHFRFSLQFAVIFW